MNSNEDQTDIYAYHDDKFTNLLEYSELNDISGMNEIINNTPNLISIINNGDNHGFTPLMLASSHGSIDCLKILIRNGSNVNKTGNGGRTPLHYSVRSIDTNTFFHA
jgi:ankyrin repeat protein